MKQKFHELQRLLGLYVHARSSKDDFFLGQITSRIRSLIAGLIRYDLSYVRKTLAFAMVLIGAHRASAQVFEPVQINPFGLSPANTGFINPSMVDIDNDGDLDVFTSGYYTDGIKFYENTGTASTPSFAAPVNAPFGLNFPYAYAFIMTFADMDNDGDMDIVGSTLYYQYGTITYIENTGTASAPAFAAPVVGIGGSTTLPASTYIIPTVADLDNDGDLDILGGFMDYYYSDQFVYFENTGTAMAPVFGAGVKDPFGLDNQVLFFSVNKLVDLDEDGDYDILSGIYGANGAITYFENTGTASVPSFAALQLNPFGLTSVAYLSLPTGVGDLDNDGDIDLLVGDYDPYGSPNLNFFENGTINGLDDLLASEVKLYPSPAASTLTIESERLAETMSVYDATGRRVLDIAKSGSDRTQIDVSDLTPGLYSLRIQIEGRTISKQFVKN